MIDRYSYPEMAELWTRRHKLELWLEVELVWLDVLADRGQIPSDVPKRVREKARVRPERAAEIEQTVRHDVIAFLTSVTEELGPEGRFLHYGLTSSDVIDTALALQLRDANELISTELDALLQVVRAQAWTYKDQPMVGRTHGMHAEPMTLGVKIGTWFTELTRAKRRFETAASQLEYGKMSGAVGVFGTTHPEGERQALHRLGLEAEPVSSQIVPRDRHAELLFALSTIGAALERIATELRNLARPEIREAEEPFRSGQKGSSAMPHKRNPIVCERLSGQARLLRSYLSSSLENIALWHERDISHSSVERVILPDATTLTHYMLRRAKRVLSDFVVHPDKMEKNLYSSHGVVFSQRVLLALVESGWTRERAYEAVQGAAARCWDEGLSFAEALQKNSEVMDVLGADQLAQCLAMEGQLQHVETILERAGIEGGPSHEESHSEDDESDQRRFIALVRVLPKSDVLDPEGRTISKSLTKLGFESVREVRVGKLIEVELEQSSEGAARSELRSMAARLLANPVIEHFEVEEVRPA